MNLFHPQLRWALALLTFALLGLACTVPIQPPDIGKINPPSLPEIRPPNIDLPPVPEGIPPPAFTLADTPTPVPPTSQPPSNAGTEIPLTIRPIPENIPDYDRGHWRHWVDDDGDCQNARHEVLIAESETPVTFKTADNCQVATGRWTGPYTGQVLTDATQLDVDHVVPLANAHRSGAWDWTRDQKRAYANDLSDPEHLAATTRSANRAKGADGPEDWRPPDESYWCAYAQNWISIKARWDLTATPQEQDTLKEMLSTCP